MRTGDLREVVPTGAISSTRGFPDILIDMEVSFTGGARFGWANASLPLATLTASADRLSIRASLLGEMAFTPEQVIEVKRVTWFPWLAEGVVVVHTRSDAPRRIIFWTLTPGRVLHGIRDDAGFRGTASQSDQPPSMGFPLRLPFTIGTIVLWNALLVLDRPWQDPEPGVATLIAFALMFAASVAIRAPGPFQRFALKSPDALSLIRPALNIVTLVSGLLLVIFTTMVLQR